MTHPHDRCRALCGMDDRCVLDRGHRMFHHCEKCHEWPVYRGPRFGLRKKNTANSQQDVKE